MKKKRKIKKVKKKLKKKKKRVIEGYYYDGYTGKTTILYED